MSKDMDRLSADLSDAQKSALERRIRDAGRIASSSPSRIRRRADPAAPVPLSSAQQRLWVLDQLVPRNRAYNLTRTLRVEGPLSQDALRQSIREIVARHESLRTTFMNREGQPVQIIADTSVDPLSVLSLEQLPEAQREPEALEIAQRDAEALFDLSVGPLQRTTLIRLNPELHLLQVTAHHIVTDGWSMEVFFRELSALYAAFSSGEGRPLDPLSVQYPDFCIWQREFLESSAASEQIASWAEHLRGVGTLDLPIDRARPAVPTLRGAYRTRVFPMQCLDALTAISREQGATLFMTLLAAFNVFLQRHTGQDDLSVAAPIAGRNLPELETLIGFFANTIVLRSDLSGDPTFREVLGRVRECAFDSYAHQDVPFEKIVEALRPERSLAVNPIAQVLGVLQNVPPAPLRLKGAKVTPLESRTQTSRFDLELHATETPDGLACTLIASSDLFEDKSLERMLARFETLTESIVRTPDRRISELDLLPETERAEIFSEWNPPSRDYATGRLIHEFFEEQAHRNPDAIAAEFEDRRLSYAELNGRANQLAAHLRTLGVSPGVLVGVCLDRSLEMVIALIGVLKSGGAYVPLDPEYPAERLTFMLADAQTPVLVTASRFRSLFPEQPHIRVCSIDEDAEEIGAQESRNPGRVASPEDPAYVIYTSGSTGKPKGVVVTHHNIDRLFAATESWFHFDEHDVWTLFHSYAFDFSVWELWGALRYGGRLVVVPGSVARSPEAFRALLVRSGATVLNQTPSAFRPLIAQDEISTDPLTLRFVIFGGEALDPGMLRPWFERHGDDSPRIVNMYGITETTVHVTYRVITREDLRQPAVSAIGRPIPDLQVYILDDRLRLCPVGVPGELYVAGAGLAAGYLNRPELTLERFVANPFDDRQGQRLYKTGDRGRYLADGQLEYLGRVDQQVKIRGHRIELGEIESVLGQHPDLREAVVVAREDDPGNRRLVAYVVGSAMPPSTSELRTFLKRILPDYMVPSVFVPVERLPLTPSGKLDRKALPAPDTKRPELQGDFVPPQTEKEKVLAGIWSQVLRMERIGIHDNFFEVGGDSILSIQIVSRANQAGLRLAPSHLFQAQTIAELAAVAEAPAITAEQGLVTGKVPLTPIQSWFFEGESPDPHHFNQAFLLGLSRPDGAALEKAVGCLLRHHDALRLRFVEVGEGWEQFDSSVEENNVFSRIDLTSKSKNEQFSAIEAEAARLQRSLNLFRGPLIRVALFDLGPSVPSRLLVVVHHLAIDGVSWRILLEDLQAAYEQDCRGEEVILPPKTTSFQKWAETLTSLAQSEGVRQELDHWLAPPQGRIVRLHVDSVGVNTEQSARKVSVSLDVDETQALFRDALSERDTQINDVLLTALAEALASWIGPGTLPVNLEGHGREELAGGLDLSRTVGWFTSIFPVPLPLREGVQPAAMMKMVQQRLRAVPNRGVGYGMLRYLAADTEIPAWLKALPQPEISFNYLGRFDLFPDSSTFQMTGESSGPIHSPRGQRRHLLEVQGLVFGGRLRMDWSYSENIHRRETIERIATRFVETLRKLIAHGRSIAKGAYAPSDFPLAGLDQERLDRVIRKLSKR